MFDSENGRKLNFEFVVIVRCFGVGINLRMCIFLYRVFCIFWVKSLLGRVIVELVRSDRVGCIII